MDIALLTRVMSPNRASVAEGEREQPFGLLDSWTSGHGSSENGAHRTPLSALTRYINGILHAEILETRVSSSFQVSKGINPPENIHNLIESNLIHLVHAEPQRPKDVTVRDCLREKYTRRLRHYSTSYFCILFTNPLQTRHHHSVINKPVF